jgi:hypothetical protein
MKTIIRYVGLVILWLLALAFLVVFVCALPVLMPLLMLLLTMIAPGWLKKDAPAVLE